MGVQIRCKECGRLIEARGRRARCGVCGSATPVPASLAEMPAPRVPPDAVSAPAVNVTQGDEDESGMAVGLAAAMPWVLSLLLHVGLFLVMLFFVLVTTTRVDEPTVPVTFTRQPQPFRGDFSNAGDAKRSPRDADAQRRRPVRSYDDRREKIDRGETKERVQLLAAGATGGRTSAEELGLHDRSSDRGPEFFDVVPVPGGGAMSVIYAVDRSGSMARAFDQVRVEMIKSIRDLKPPVRFHIVLFAANRTIEGPRRGLVPATDMYKAEAVRFLARVNCVGTTTALPALKRAFAAFDAAPENRPGRLLYVLSDGDFAGVTGGSTYRTPGGRRLQGNEAVVRWLRDHNADRDVMINTLLLHGRDASAFEVLRTVAAENGGVFKYVSPDE